MGTEIIDDDLDSGSEEPNSVSTGDTFIFSSTATLFSTNTGSEVGSENFNGTFKVKEMETIIAPAGSFQNLKIDFTMTMEVNKTVGIPSYSGNSAGSLWFDVEKGFLIKRSLSLDLTFSVLDITAVTSSEMLLYDYQIDSNKKSKSLHKTDNYSIIRGLNSLHKRVILKIYE